MLVSPFDSAGIEKDDNEIEDLLKNEHSIIYPQVTINIQQTKQTLNDMTERHFDIMLFENSIQEIHDMYTCLANIVELEGIKVTSINEYLSKAAAHTEKTRAIILDAKILHHPSRKLFRKKIVSLCSSSWRLFASCIYY
ncbi:unnamed protein product [Rotaria sp. Silwood2]|nr:unnamed protein product [Rotaria sp. Silwood2]CAF2639194.1 unnamed protein product [Rotaria sp. Silwood2]CAF2972367.1 unnamed protein product [Rotaria sp. Silwood2]CAF3124702.1 unnamed protein product [Rotaria sp. Silwood2]CAF3941401.1 unnamed protein product [Rotaria sp. Silwood2]